MADPARTLTMDQYLDLPEQERMAARVACLMRVLNREERPQRRFGIETAKPRKAPVEQTATLSHSVGPLDDLFRHVLEEVFDAEHALLFHMIPMLERHASSESLLSIFIEQKNTNLGQTERVQSIFRRLNMSAASEQSTMVRSIVKELSQLTEVLEPGEALDRALIEAAQVVEQYKISRYECLIGWASELDYDDIVRLLRGSLAEETAANMALDKLSGIQSRTRVA